MHDVHSDVERKWKTGKRGHEMKFMRKEEEQNLIHMSTICDT